MDKKLEIIFRLCAHNNGARKFFPTDNQILNKFRFACWYNGVISTNDDKLRYFNACVNKRLKEGLPVDIEFCKPACSLIGIDWHYLEEDKCIFCDIDKFVIEPALYC